MKTFTKYVLLSALILGLSGNVYAQRNPDKQGQGQRPDRAQNMQDPERMHQRMVNMLDLNEDQQAAIEKIHTNGKKQMLAFRTQLDEKQAQLRTATTSGNYDQKAIKKLAAEIGDLHESMILTRTAHQQQIRTLLTEEQQVKFDQFHLRMAKKRMRGSMMKR